MTNKHTDGKLSRTILSISLLTVMAGAAIAPFKAGILIGVIYLLQSHFTRRQQTVE